MSRVCACVSAKCSSTQPHSSLLPRRWIVLLRVVPFSQFITAATKRGGKINFLLSLMKMAGGIVPNPAVSVTQAVLAVAVAGWM